MNRTQKQVQEHLRQLLLQNVPPETDTAEKKEQLIQLNQAVRDMDYCNPQSFVEKILTQFSYLSPWIWLVQAGYLAILFYTACRGVREHLVGFLLFLAPCLILILLLELSKTFGHNMWELESVCRYNLARLFFFRLCILSGADFLVLGGALAAFQITGGQLWQFALCVLLPFFLCASICLWLLRHFGNRANNIGMAVACLMLFMFWTLLISSPITENLLYNVHDPEYPISYPISLPQTALWATLIAVILFIISAFRLCTKQYYETNRKDQSIWNLE